MRSTCLQIAVAAGLPGGRNKTTAEFAFHCPRHNDARPSLLVNKLKNCFFCGPCGRGGGPWSFAAFVSGFDVSDKAAIADWLEELGL